jgi:hypothetical protein
LGFFLDADYYYCLSRSLRDIGYGKKRSRTSRLLFFFLFFFFLSPNMGHGEPAAPTSEP